MKKIIYKSIPVILAVFFLTSCYDLDKFPQDELSSGTFWKTDADAKSGVMAVYNAMRLEQVYFMYFAMDCASDVGTGYWIGYEDVSRSLWTSRTDFVGNRWQQTYEGIQRANTVIRNVSESSAISDQVKANVTGEAKFLRALFYFFLLNHYGGVPIYDETTDYNKEYMTLLKSRSSAEEVRNFILKDLDDAISSLPVKWTSSDYGRVTKGAAYALRGKVYLYNKQYDKAASDFEEIVLDPSGEGYGYKLYDSYADLFTQKGDASEEMIFAIQAYNAQGENYGFPYAHYMGSMAAYGPGWNIVMPDVRLVDSYERKDGHSFNWDDYIPGYNQDVNVRKEVFMSTLTSDKKTVQSYPRYLNELLAMYEDRDPRMKQSIILPYTHYNGWVGAKLKDCEFVYANGVSTTNGFVVLDTYGNYNTLLYLFRKFVPEGDMNGQISSRTAIPINFPIIRYADVLLMLAECYNEQGDADEAVKYINMVRQRPSTNMPAINNGEAWMEAGTKEEVFSRIMHERAVEFAGEGLRYYDLMRWKKMESVMNSPETDILGSKIFDNVFNSSRDYLWPIPGTEIDMNADLTQNPGWQ